MGHKRRCGSHLAFSGGHGPVEPRATMWEVWPPWSCHAAETMRGDHMDIEIPQESQLFQPRSQMWEETFSLSNPRPWLQPYRRPRDQLIPSTGTPGKNNRWLLPFYATEFGVVCYIILDNQTAAGVCPGLGSLLEPQLPPSPIHPLLRKIHKVVMFTVSSPFAFKSISWVVPLLKPSEPMGGISSPPDVPFHSSPLDR